MPPKKLTQAFGFCLRCRSHTHVDDSHCEWNDAIDEGEQDNVGPEREDFSYLDVV